MGLDQKPTVSPRTKDYIGKSIAKHTAFMHDSKSGSVRYWVNVKFRDKWDIFYKNIRNESVIQNSKENKIDMFSKKTSHLSQVELIPIEKFKEKTNYNDKDIENLSRDGDISIPKDGFIQIN